MMHTVIEADCTGCELCIAVCPVDCISLENISADKTGWAAWSEPEAQKAGQRYAFHSQRLNLPGLSPTSSSKPEADRKQTLINAALASARDKAATRKLAQ